jgi:hypothetical protein
MIATTVRDDPVFSRSVVELQAVGRINRPPLSAVSASMEVSAGDRWRRAFGQRLEGVVLSVARMASA